MIEEEKTVDRGSNTMIERPQRKPRDSRVVNAKEPLFLPSIGILEDEQFHKVTHLNRNDIK